MSPGERLATVLQLIDDQRRGLHELLAEALAADDTGVAHRRLRVWKAVVRRLLTVRVGELAATLFRDYADYGSTFVRPWPDIEAEVGTYDDELANLAAVLARDPARLPFLATSTTAVAPPSATVTGGALPCCASSLTVATTAAVQYPDSRGQGSDFARLATFSAELVPSDPATPNCCEFRQELRGSFLIDNTVLPHDLGNGVLLDAALWQEDGDASMTPPRRYGHRSQWNVIGHDVYGEPDRATGTRYVGFDAPGCENVPATKSVDIDLEFRCSIRCACTGTLQTLDEQTWETKMLARIA